MSEDKKGIMKLHRKSDGKVITLEELIQLYKDGEIKEEDDDIYGYRSNEEQEKIISWIHVKELKIWATDKEIR